MGGCSHNVSKVTCAERSEGTASACPDDNTVGTEVLSRWRRQVDRVVVRSRAGRFGALTAPVARDSRSPALAVPPWARSTCELHKAPLPVVRCSNSVGDAEPRTIERSSATTLDPHFVLDRPPNAIAVVVPLRANRSR